MDYLDPFQSGFRPGFEMGLALVALVDDLWQGQDGGCVFILTLLDLSAAFDAINHTINLDQLRGLEVGSMVSPSFFRINSNPWFYGEGEKSSLSLYCGRDVQEMMLSLCSYLKCT